MWKSDQYIGDSDVENELRKTIETPKGYTVQSIDTFLFDTNPDRNGVAKVYAKYTIGKSAYSGNTLGGGATFKTKNKTESGVFEIKILK